MINVPRFYSAKKKKKRHAHPSSMECESSIQSPMNLAAPIAPLKSDCQQQSHNAQSELTPRTDTLPAQPNGDNCEIQRVMNENITPAVSDKAITQNDS